jgi:hypothetical protein
MSSVQLSGAGVAAVAFTSKGLASAPSTLKTLLGQALIP